ncbi:hypothetical protein Y1Q_0005994 [Alligator mississippiensis]|uniref:Uncharacterized protein n=1 Tax=Alligator mississippiensis TaxID=8496 RepID=A0A151N3N1_ALLMI|nr:hypothetical protein Y1Q_0005994 [Alligator mississippiensis]
MAPPCCLHPHQHHLWATPSPYAQNEVKKHGVKHGNVLMQQKQVARIANQYPNLENNRSSFSGLRPPHGKMTQQRLSTGKLLFHGAHFYTHQKFGVVDSGPFPWRGPHQTLQVLLPNLQQGLLLSLYEMRPLDISMLPLLQVVGTKFIGCFKKSANCHEPNP